MNNEEIVKCIVKNFSVEDSEITYHEGHYQQYGKDAKMMKNPLWQFDKENIRRME
jgi:hypothetical protein